MPTDDFSTLFEFLPIGAYRVSAQGRQLRANPALVRLNGFGSETEQLAAVSDIANHWYVDPSRRDEFLRLIQCDGHVLAFESEIRAYRSRRRIWISENAHAVRHADGTLLYIEGTIEDITERVRDRENLRRSEQHLQEILDLVPGVVYRTVVTADGQRRMSFVSPGVRDLFGLEPAALMADGNALQRLRHPDDRARVGAEVDSSVDAHTPLQTELRAVLDSGEQKWVQLISAPAPDEDGQPVRVGLIVDITARKQAEAALRESGELWKRALESTGDGVWDWHIDEGVEELSAACRSLYGYGRAELPDRPDALDALTHPEDIAAMRVARESHLAGATSVYVNEHRVRCHDGRYKRILSRGVVIARDPSGRPTRMVGTHTDVTDRRAAEALRAERDRAEAADRAKSQFLSRVSHELRTPLNAILGFAQLLDMESFADERHRSWIGQVLGSGRHLLALMDDVLDLSSLQTGQLQLSIQRLPLRPVVTQVVAMLHGTAEEAGVSIEIAIEAEPDVMLQADPTRLAQLLSNLLSNAIKYNRRGGWVRIEAGIQASEAVVRMVDGGVGLDASQMARLFTPFERVGAQRGPVAGTGLGLALTRQLTEAMNGSVAASSEPGVGSVFTLRLPAG
ncbi:MAG: PAS domain-containing protein [Rubrivivax sp.]